MKIIKIVPAVAITVLCNACESTSSNSIVFDSSEENQSNVTLDKPNDMERTSLAQNEVQIQRDLNVTDLNPFITETPAKQIHEPFLIPKEKVENIRVFFQKKVEYL